MSIQVEGLTPLVQVFDMPRSLRFYRDVLGFQVVESSEPGDNCDWALLRSGMAELMLNTAYERDDRPAEPDPLRVAAHEDTSLFIGCPDVDEAYRHLVAAGVRVDPPKVASYGMKQLSLRDPDGYGICFQWPANPTED